MSFSGNNLLGLEENLDISYLPEEDTFKELPYPLTVMTRVQQGREC
jgi:hypothetical protein